jgi:hypothetical protein
MSSEGTLERFMIVSPHHGQFNFQQSKQLDVGLCSECRSKCVLYTCKAPFNLGFSEPELHLYLQDNNFQSMCSSYSWDDLITLEHMKRVIPGFLDQDHEYISALVGTDKQYSVELHDHITPKCLVAPICFIWKPTYILNRGLQIPTNTRAMLNNYLRQVKQTQTLLCSDREFRNRSNLGVVSRPNLSETEVGLLNNMAIGELTVFNEGVMRLHSLVCSVFVITHLYQLLEFVLFKNASSVYYALTSADTCFIHCDIRLVMRRVIRWMSSTEMCHLALMLCSHVNDKDFKYKDILEIVTESIVKYSDFVVYMPRYTTSISSLSASLIKYRNNVYRCKHQRQKLASQLHCTSSGQQDQDACAKLLHLYLE